ncbi:MAG: carboxyl transferase domain-containing protein, partial [Myxococcota bacterium]|nr:carboxyl transferase domain-containing protein [Myxococcota bacterium]
MARLTYLPIGSPLQASPERQANAARILEREQRLSALRADAALAWGEKYRQRVHAKGKLTLEERLSALVDPGSRRFELGSLVHHGRSFAGRTAPRAGVFTGIAQVQQRWVMLIGNDNTVASGAWWPGTPEKIQRAQSLALRLRIPVVYLVDSSGLFLPEQRHSFPGAQGAGGIFRMNSLLSDAGVVQLAAVLGDCIAGGGYMPIISDYVVMSEQAYMVIAGAALVGGAKHELIDPLSIGGADVHVHQSACADARAPDDRAAIAMLRQQVAQLPSSAHPFYRHGVCAAPPLFSPTELAQLLPSEPSQSYDIFEILARLLDDSLFCELLSGFGTELVTGVGRISGLPVGIIANRQGLCPDNVGARAGGILYRDGICKLSLFSRACDDDGLVLIWLQDVAGFDVG